MDDTFDISDDLKHIFNYERAKANIQKHLDDGNELPPIIHGIRDENYKEKFEEFIRTQFPGKDNLYKTK